MPSLLPGYTYDIFISYRHKDNKYDGWVSEFVANLRKEIDATIKEDVSIYFDENPEDGLRETNDVDASLSGKLRCLILIPILSQTYCDQKSFAWKSEFLAFNELIKTDGIGPKVTLSNGNVSSRILPVRIHDLDPTDKNLIESVIGPLRSIDFIYREQGVNRPLRPADSKSDNLNKTDYRNQVNKLANAVKDLITGITNPKAAPVAENIARVSKQEKSKRGIMIASVIAVLVVLTGVAAFVWFGTNKAEDNFKYDVAVLYFENLTEDEKYSDGLVNLVQTNLSEDTSLSVAPRHMLYEKLKALNPDSKVPDQSVATDLAKSIQARFMITGSVIQQSSEVMAQVELIEVSTGKVVVSKKVRGAKDNIFSIADGISGQLMKGRSLQKEYNVQQVSTGNYEAYKEFYKGLELLWKMELASASLAFDRAIQLDSSFAAAYVYKVTADNPYISWTVYSDPGKSVALLERATRDMHRLTRKDQLLAKVTMARFRAEEGQSELVDQLISIDPDDGFSTLLSGLTAFTRKTVVAAHESYIKRHPTEYDIYNNLAYMYSSLGDREKARYYADEYMRTNPGVYNSAHTGWEIHVLTGDLEGSRKIAERLLKEFPKNKGRATWTGVQALLENKPEEALAVYTKWKDSTSLLEMKTIGYNAAILKGQVNKARNIADSEIKDARAHDANHRVFYFRTDKALMYSYAGLNTEAMNEFDRIIKESSIELEYNPYVFLVHFFKGLDYVKTGDKEMATKEIAILSELRRDKKYDGRFQGYLNILIAENALADGNLDVAKKTLESKLNIPGPASIFYISLNLKYLIASNQLKEALAFIDSINTQISGGRPDAGGSQLVLVELISLRDYYRGIVYEKMGDKQLAKKSYESFTKQMKKADVKSVQMKDAEAALKRL